MHFLCNIILSYLLLRTILYVRLSRPTNHEQLLKIQFNWYDIGVETRRGRRTPSGSKTNTLEMFTGEVIDNHGRSTCTSIIYTHG